MTGNHGWFHARISPTATTALCALNAHGKVVKEAKVGSEPEALIAVLREIPGKVVVVGLEAGPLSQWLHARGGG